MFEDELQISNVNKGNTELPIKRKLYLSSLFQGFICTGWRKILTSLYLILPIYFIILITKEVLHLKKMLASERGIGGGKEWTENSCIFVNLHILLWEKLKVFFFKMRSSTRKLCR